MLTLLLSTACGKEDVQQVSVGTIEAWVGRWDNVNDFSDQISRIVITREAAQLLSVQWWQRCRDTTIHCEPGSQSVPIGDLDDGVLVLLWRQGGRVQPLEGRLTSEQLLELRSNDEQASGFDREYFSREKDRTLFQQVGWEDARAANLSRTPIDGSLRDGNQLTPGSILVYKTSQGRYGKIQIRGNDEILTMRWITWNAGGTTHTGSDYLAIHPAAAFDMDTGTEDRAEAMPAADFFWHDQGRGSRRLETRNGAAFAVFHIE